MGWLLVLWLYIYIYIYIYMYIYIYGYIAPGVGENSDPLTNGWHVLAMKSRFQKRC